MARFVDVHPENPQPRLLEQVVTALREEDALIAYPTDSGYAISASSSRSAVTTWSSSRGCGFSG